MRAPNRVQVTCVTRSLYRGGVVLLLEEKAKALVHSVSSVPRKVKAAKKAKTER